LIYVAFICARLLRIPILIINLPKRQNCKLQTVPLIMFLPANLINCDYDWTRRLLWLGPGEGVNHQFMDVAVCYCTRNMTSSITSIDPCDNNCISKNSVGHNLFEQTEVKKSIKAHRHSLICRKRIT